jgi:hypothetical protein
MRGYLVATVVLGLGLSVSHAQTPPPTPAPAPVTNTPAPAPPEPDKPWAEGVPLEKRDQALAIYKEGNGLFEQSQYVEALSKYRDALAHWDHPAIRYNIAVCQIHTEENVEALANLEAGLRYGAEPIGDELYKEGLTYKKLLEGQVARLKVSCSEEGAEVVIDGKPLLSCPGDSTVVVKPGAHQVVASKAGYLTFTENLQLVSGSTRDLEVRLTRIVDVKVTYKTRWPKWLPWTIAGAGLAVAVVGIPLEVSASSDFQDYDERLAEECPRGCPVDGVPSEIIDLEDSGRLKNRLAIAAFAVGGAAVAAGLTMVVLNRPEAVEAPVQVQAGPDGVAASVRWSF